MESTHLCIQWISIAHCGMSVSQSIRCGTMGSIPWDTDQCGNWEEDARSGQKHSENASTCECNSLHSIMINFSDFDLIINLQFNFIIYLIVYRIILKIKIIRLQYIMIMNASSKSINRLFWWGNSSMLGVREKVRVLRKNGIIERKARKQA